MNINLKLSGIVEKIIDEMVMKGYAASKTEAIRIALLDYKFHHIEKEDDLMNREDLAEFDKALKEHKAGKSLSLEDV